ncbi:MAG: hypothetical protein N4A72_00345 [Bacteroidales bacterium]|jgi:hypothetical protein|nr:hypothetical protein [Bacteroidales bacterium]
MIKVLLTFDYEPPLGGFKSAHKALFDPTEKIINLASEKKVPLVLFADVCSLQRYKEWDYEGYYKPFVDQIKKAVSLKHDVQLHLHPHWLTSEFNDGKYIPSKDFSLSDFKTEKKGYTIPGIVSKGVDILKDICSSVDSEYRCVAYRAGGYRIASATSDIVSAMLDNDIKVDSSVISGFFSKSELYTTNFPKVKRNHWYISSDQDLFDAAESGLLEIPITSKPVGINGILSRRIRKMRYKKELKERSYNNTGRGFHDGNYSLSLKEKIKMITNPVRLTFDSSYMGVKDLAGIVSHSIKYNSDNSGDTYITAISHPKSMGNYHISLMGDFIDYMREQYAGEIEFVTYQTLFNDKGNL